VKLTSGGDTSGAEKFAEKYYRGKQGLDCYLKIMEAWSYLDRWNPADNNRARQLAEEAIAMCPENPAGYSLLGWTYKRDYQQGNTKSPQEALEKSLELAQKALAMGDSTVHSLLCSIYCFRREWDKAIAEGERAVALNPNGAIALECYAGALAIAGKPEEAIPLYQKAIRLSPLGPSYLYHDLGGALRNTGRYDEAVSAYKKAIQIAPDDIGAHIGLAATYSMMGREKEAHAEAAEVLRINPKFSVDYWYNYFSSIYKDQSIRDRLLAALRKAGLK